MSYKFLLLFFLTWSFIDINEVKGQTDSLEILSSSPSKDTALQIKQMFMEMFGVSGIPAVHSRKSCNCGCDIKKEAYLTRDINRRFESYDFCDSQVFEWYSNDGNSEDLIRDVQMGLTKLGYLHLNSDPIKSTRFKTEKYRIEGKDILTFLELTRMKNKSIKLKVSIATP